MAATFHRTHTPLLVRLWRALLLAEARWHLRCVEDEVEHYAGKPVVGAAYLINCENQRQALRDRIRQLEAGQ